MTGFMILNFGFKKVQKQPKRKIMTNYRWAIFVDETWDLVTRKDFQAEDWDEACKIAERQATDEMGILFDDQRISFTFWSGSGPDERKAYFADESGHLVWRVRVYDEHIYDMKQKRDYMEYYGVSEEDYEVRLKEWAEYYEKRLNRWGKGGSQCK